MTRLLPRVIGLLLVCACAQAQSTPRDTETASKRVTLSVVGINDLHGRVEQLPLLGGYVRNVREARARDGGGVLLLDAGDIFQGTLESNLEEGAAMIDAYHALGVTAAALGNHELDFGPEGPRAVPVDSADDPLGALKARVRQAKFPMLSTNLRSKTDTSKLPVPGVTRSALVWAAGVRVGLVGAMTEAALTATHAANVQGLTVLPLATTVGDEALALRKRGAKVVIAVVHAGGDCQGVQPADKPDDVTGCDDKSEIFELARKLPKGAVDAIVGGHTHALVAHRVGGIPIIESFANGHAFGRVDLVLERPGGRVVAAKIFEPVRLCKDALSAGICTQTTYEGDRVERDARVVAAVAPYIARAEHAKNAPLGVEVTHSVERSSIMESPLSNLVADLMLRAFPGADAALNNGGSIRVALPQGPLTYGHVFEVFPFDNTFATLSVRADALARIVARSLSGDRSIVALSGVHARARCLHGELTVTLSRRDGTPIPADTLLRVITSDYVATRGDGLVEDVVTDDHIEWHRDKPVRDALVDGLRALPGGRLDGRDLALFDTKRRRIDYPGTRPVTCR